MLRTLGTIVKWVILLPVLLAVVLFAVANDQSVTVNLNPFDKTDPVLRVDLALYQIGFIVFALGVLVGGLIAWSSGARRRRRAGREDAALWQARAEWSGQRRAPEPRRPAEPRTSQASAFLPRPERG